MDDRTTWNHDTVAANGLSFHYVEAGRGPLVLLLHGFPEFWYSWREQLTPLADAGYRAVAPDLRGYNGTEKPTGVERYAVDELVADVAELVEALGHEAAHLVGHDWGGFVAWETAGRRPEVVDRLVSVGVTHPVAFDRGLDRFDQFRRAWYTYFLRLPGLPERALRANDYAAHERMVSDGVGRDDAFDDADFERYRDALAEPGALTAMVNYYRANLGKRFLRKLVLPRFGRRVSSTGFEAGRITAPTMILYGEQDHFDAAAMFDGVDRWVEDLRLERFPDTGHWVQLERPSRTNELLREFLGDAGDG